MKLQKSRVGKLGVYEKYRNNQIIHIMVTFNIKLNEYARGSLTILVYKNLKYIFVGI